MGRVARRQHLVARFVTDVPGTEFARAMGEELARLGG
jgi:hypothetical protein